MPEKVCNSRIRNRDTSLYASCQTFQYQHSSTLKVIYLLSKAHSRSGIEREEYERVRQEIPP